MNEYESVGLSYFFGGQSQSKQLGTKGQFYYSRAVDFRKEPTSFSALPVTTKTDGGVVTDLVQDMDQVTSGVRYAVGDAGNVYKVSSAGVWSLLGQLGENGGAGLVYRSDVDMAYVAGTNKIARIKRIATSGTFEQNWFQNGISTSSTCYKTGGTNTYIPPISISETALNKRTFTSDIEPIYKIGIKIINKGTGNWTLTLHDDADNSLGSVIVTNANLNNNAKNYFTFTTPIRIQRGNNGAGSALTYHYHVTSTVADGTLATTTAGSLADCDMELWANALVSTQNGLHPMLSFLNFTLIGNGRYVAAYEPLQDSPTTADFLRHRITLPPGFEVCGFTQKNLLCIIGGEKRSTTGDFQEGVLIFWDGISESYNDWWPVPSGAPESLFSHENVARYISGGALYRIRGTDVPQKERTFRNTDSEYSSLTDTTHAPPHGMTVRRGILLMGYPWSTTNQALEHGVYSLGAISREYPESFGFSYITSNGNILNNGSNNLRIGMVKSYGDTLFISWRDDSSNPHAYGVDIVNNSSAPAATNIIESLSFDDQRPAYWKKAGFIIATFAEDIPAGTSILLKYKINGEASWNYSEATTSGNYATFPIEKRFLKIEFGADITVGATTYNCDGLFLYYDPLKKEKPLGVV